MKKFLGLLDFCGKYGILILVAWVLTNAVRLETAYLNKYENSYVALEREHVRQIVVAEVILSQQAWERAADTLSRYAEKERLSKEYVLRFLSEKHPEVYKELTNGS